MGIENINLDGDFSVDVANWEKYNTDKTKGPWIRINHDWCIDPRVQQLTPSQQLLYIHLLCLRGRFRKPIEKVSIRYLKGLWNLPGTSMKGSILKLLKLGLLVPYERTNEQDKTPDFSDFKKEPIKKQDSGAEDHPEFEAIWSGYPKAGRCDKPRALRYFKRLTASEKSKLAIAVKNLALEHERKLKPGEFRPNPKHITTFINQKSYLEWAERAPQRSGPKINLDEVWKTK